MTREKMLRRYASADVFLMLATHEAYGITVAETHMSGTLYIIAMGSAINEFVDGRTYIGLIYPINTDKITSTIESVRRFPTNHA